MQAKMLPMLKTNFQWCWKITTWLRLRIMKVISEQLKNKVVNVEHFCIFSYDEVPWQAYIILLIFFDAMQKDYFFDFFTYCIKCTLKERGMTKYLVAMWFYINIWFVWAFIQGLSKRWFSIEFIFEQVLFEVKLRAL